MAASVDLKSVLNFKFKCTLFRKPEDFTPIDFYSSVYNEDLKIVISKGGGYLTEKKQDASVLICESRVDPKINEGFLPYSFLVDCALKNKFLDVDKYRQDVLGLNLSSSVSVIGSKRSMDDDLKRKESASGSKVKSWYDLSPSPSITLLLFSTLVILSMSKVRDTNHSPKFLRRKRYSQLEDFMIIEYIIKHGIYSKTSGLAVWKKMESLKVTQHSYQSMKARFRLIRPKLDNYDIQEEWKLQLRSDKKLGESHMLVCHKVTVQKFMWI